MPVQEGIASLSRFDGVDRSLPDHELEDGQLRIRSNFSTEDRRALTKSRGAINITTAGATAIGDIKNLYRYYYAAAGKQWLVQPGSSVYQVTNNNFSAVGSGFSTTKTRNFWVFDDICFSVNDYDPIQHYHGTNTMAAATYSAPSSPAISTGSAGALTGLYAYKLAYRYLHDVYNAGPTSTSLTLSAHKVVISIPATTKPILGVEIYRTRDMSTAPGTATQLYYLDYVSGTASSTHTDNEPDYRLVIDESQLTASTKTNAPTCQYGCFAQRRNIVGGGGTYPDSFYYSEFDKPYTFYPTNYYRVDDDITGIAERKGEVYIFQRGSIARLSGIIGLNETLRRNITPGIGAIAPRTIKLTDYGAFFLANDRTVRIFDGQQAHIISDPVEDYLASALATYLPSATAVFVGNKYKLWFSITGATHTCCVVYDVAARQWYTEAGYYPVAADVADEGGDGGDVYFSYKGYVYQAETGNAIYMLASSTSGTVATATYSISSVAVSKVYDMGVPGCTKQIRKVEATWEGGDGTEYIEIIADRGLQRTTLTLPPGVGGYVWGDASSSAGSAMVGVWAASKNDEYAMTWGRASDEPQQKHVGIPGGIAGKTFQFKVVATGTTAFSLKQLRFYYWHYEV